MKKLTEEQRKEIVLSHYLNNSNENIQALMTKYDLSKQGLYNVINSNKAKGYIKECEPTLTKNLNEIIEIAILKLKQALLEEDLKALDIAKILGIVYDKSRLESNLSTENKAISINIKIEK